MAHLLKKIGHTDVTVLEKAATVGGRARTVAPAGFGDVPHDVGAAHLAPTFHRMRTLASEFGFDLTASSPAIVPNKDLVEVLVAKRATSSTGSSPKAKPLAVSKFLFDSDGPVDLEVPSLQCLPLHLSPSSKPLEAAVFKYVKLHRELFGVYEYGLPPPLGGDKLKKVDMTFTAFLDKHDLEVLKPVFDLAGALHGIPPNERTPAFYGLW